MTKQIEPDIEDARCECTDDYGCDHASERCPERLSDEEKKEDPPRKCQKCWIKDSEYRTKQGLLPRVFRRVGVD
jgi:hypothetical protein